MAGTTGLEPATSDVTGRNARVESQRFNDVFSICWLAKSRHRMPRNDQLSHLSLTHLLTHPVETSTIWVQRLDRFVARELCAFSDHVRRLIKTGQFTTRCWDLCLPVLDRSLENIQLLTYQSPNNARNPSCSKCISLVSTSLMS